MTRRSVRGSRVLVTGASSGIGRALAVELAARGADLLLTARRVEALEQTQQQVAERGGRATLVVGDLAAAETRAALVAAVESTWGALDILVNNAGVGARGPFKDAGAERLRRIMEVNFLAPCELIRDCLPLLGRGRQPLIANVSSVLGHRAAPNRSEYCASKFAMHGFSDALRAELYGEGIDVLLISPSTTATEFTDHVLEDRGAHKTFSRAMSAETVARRSVRAMESGRHEIILSWGAKGLVWLDRLCPPLADWLVARFG